MKTTLSRWLQFFALLGSAVPLAALTRADVIQNIGPYRDLSWTMAQRNVLNLCSSPKWTQTPFASGASVTGEPYNWGGWTTPTDFRTAIAGSAYAGNRCTSTQGNPYGFMANTVGVDCSGFLTRLWQLSGKLSTSSNANPSVQSVTVAIRGGIANAKYTMRPGDVFLKTDSHVAVLVSSTASGPVVAEAVGTYWRVVQRPSLWSDWSAYEPRRYPNLQDAGLGLLVLLSPPATVRSGSAMSVQATIRETDGNAIKFDEITIAVIKDGTNAYQFDLTHLTNVSFSGDQTRTLTFTGNAPRVVGKYRVILRGRVGSQWTDFLPAPPAVNSVPFTVTN
jgi:hypothetical protein